jgi:hypothetical protein
VRTGVFGGHHPGPLIEGNFPHARRRSPRARRIDAGAFGKRHQRAFELVTGDGPGRTSGAWRNELSIVT